MPWDEIQRHLLSKKVQIHFMINRATFEISAPILVYNFIVVYIFIGSFWKEAML